MKKVLLVIGVAMSLLVGTASANLVANPGFETGDLSDWFSGGVTVVSDNGPSATGQYCAEIVLFGDVRSLAMSVTSGQIMTFSFDYKTVGATAGLARAQLRFFENCSPDGRETADPWVGELNLLVGDTGGLWAVASGDVEVPMDARYADVRICGAGIFQDGGPGNPGQLLRVDNISVVPEPATLALLSLGGLLLRKRN